MAMDPQMAMIMIIGDIHMEHRKIDGPFVASGNLA